MLFSVLHRVVVQDRRVSRVRKAKSINDIYRQLDRIYANPMVTQSRIGRAEEAAGQYEQNILDRTGNRRPFVDAARRMAAGDKSARSTISRIQNTRYYGYRTGENMQAIANSNG